MKQSKWLAISCATALTVAMIQPVLAHDWRSNDGYGNENSYGGPMMGMPGNYGAYGYDQRGPHGYGAYRPGHHGMDKNNIFHRLDLSDEQQKSIRKIMHESRSGFRKLEEKIRDKRYDLYDQIDEASDSKKIDKLADEIGVLMADRIKLRVQMRMKIMKELTPDQREEARDIPFFGR